MIRMLIAAAMLVVGIAVNGPIHARDRDRVVIEVIIDTGATMMAEDREETTKLFLASLRDLPGGEFRHARIDIILTSEPTTVWSGDRKALRSDVLDVLKKIKPTDKCSDLSRAIREAETNLRLAGASSAYVLVFASLIDTPFPCNEREFELPQEPATTLEIGMLVRNHNVKALRFFGVNPHQKRPWLLYLEQEGIVAMERTGKLDFGLLDMAQGRSALMKGELLERRR